MTSLPSQCSPRWLAQVGVLSASAALIVFFWQCAFMGLSLAVGSYISEMEGILRVSAASAVVASFATWPLARMLLRRASRSTALAIALIPIGLGGVYVAMPTVFVYAVF